MLKIFKRKEPVISLAEHERLLQVERDTASRFLGKNLALIERYEASLATKDETIGRVCRHRDNYQQAYMNAIAERDALQAKIDRMTSGLRRGGKKRETV